jgi:hypothetical protein
MRQETDHILQDCLALLEQGQITPEECLHRYPDHARELRVLIPLALEARRVSLPSPSLSAIETWERQMFAALDKKESRQPTALARLARAFRLRRLVYVGLALVAAFLVGALFFGARTTIAQAATLTDVSGAVEVLQAGDVVWKPVSTGQMVNVGDRLRVDSHSAAILSFPGGCSTDLHANADIDLLQIGVQRNGRGGAVVLYQRLGQTRSCVQRSPGYDARFEIRTPSASIRGKDTEFTVTVRVDGTTNVAVAQGAVEVMGQALSVFVRAGEATSVEPEQPPIPVFTVPSLTKEPAETLEAEELETPEPGEPEETEESEERESPEPPEAEEVEEPDEHETSEPGEPDETQESEESEEPEEPEEHKEHETPEPEEPAGTGEPEEIEEPEEAEEPGEVEEPEKPEEPEESD